jgi:DNA repair photolyase
MEYGTMLCRTALSPSRLPGLKYSLNPYFGCEHGCLYCYARSVFHDEEIAQTWGTFVKAKSNIPETLARELRRKDKGTIGLSTVTDPYQPVESRLQLTRACLQVLKNCGFKVSIQTKSSLVLRDIDLISGPMFEVGVTITTMNPELAGKMEPRASPPDERQQILESYRERKVETWIFLGPIIPDVNDRIEDIEQIVRVAKATSSRLLFDKLNLRPWVLQSLAPFLAEEAPESLENLPVLLSGRSGYWNEISAKVGSLCRDLGVRCEPAFSFTQNDQKLRRSLN